MGDCTLGGMLPLVVEVVVGGDSLVASIGSERLSILESSRRALRIGSPESSEGIVDDGVFVKMLVISLAACRK